MITFRRSLTLGLSSLWRDLRAGQLTVLLLAVLLAVGALTAVAFFADRLQGGLHRDARQLLGADVVLASDHGISAQLRESARQLGLETAVTVAFPSMARAGSGEEEVSRLVSLKAVEPAYPLRGTLRTTTHRDAAMPDVVAQNSGEPTADVPAAGDAWVDPALLAGLDLHVGDMLHIGDSEFHIRRVITYEPDRGAGFLSFSPRVMIGMDDLAATGLMQPGSRLNWRLLVAGANPEAVARFERLMQERIDSGTERGLRLLTLQSSNPQMQLTIERADSFLRLVALLAAFLSAVAVALAARAFANNHLDGAALWRVLGLSQRAIVGIYLVEFVVAGVLASLAGSLLGYGVHLVFVHLLAGLLQVALPAASLWPVLLGVGMGLALLVAFGLAPVLQLAKVPPLRVMRRDIGALQPASRGVMVAGVAGFAVLLLLISGGLTLGAIAVGGFALALLLFAGLAALAIRVLRALVRESTAPRWLVLATRQVAARPVFAVIQISALAVGLLALMLLVLLRTDLIESWQQATSSDGNNRFVVNIQPDQAQAFRAALTQAGVTGFQWYPMVRGRLTEINGQPVHAGNYQDEQTRRQVEREFNLSYSPDLPSDNQVAQGQWQPGQQGSVSIEQGLARQLGIHLGDEVGFNAGGVLHKARVTSVRRVDWGSMNANFFFMFPVAEMSDMPVTYLAAYRAPLTPGFDNALVQQFPNVNNIDVSATLAQIRRVLEQVSRAVEVLFVFALAAGLVVLFAAVTATRLERAREYTIMRAMGAGAVLLGRVQRAELAGAGALAGLLASLAAVAIGWALARYVFEFDWQLPLWAPLLGTVAGALLAVLAGWWGLREVLRRPVSESLRHQTQQ